MDPFSQHLLYTEFYTGQDPPALNIDVTAGASVYDALSPTLSAHLSSTSYISSAAFVEEKEQQQAQPADSWFSEWDLWIDAQLKLLLLNADPAPPTSSWDVESSFTLAAYSTCLALAGTAYMPGELVEDATLPWSREEPAPVAGAPDRDMMPAPLTQLSDSLAPSTSNALLAPLPANEDTHAVVAGLSPPSLAVNAQPIPLSRPPAHSPASSGTSSPARRKHRPPPLRCTHCPFVQENGRRWDMDRHVKTHDGVRKKFVCGRRGCKEIFSRMDAVRRHQKNPNARCALAQGGHA
ncbi:hypothetical protein FA95DRAFT_1606723 [Auriscalpium vulgare]|uniref:Uncharacterized protein n=1 Tax=Auriscalpium vulgare TaxID=40419 RepID=A0ACB8RSS2_9AGAM|nr:hypothetical protein FA95DRAFT_1606723 [Auriscalpium vulgare]